MKLRDWLFGPCVCEDVNDFIDRWEQKTGEDFSSKNLPVVQEAYRHEPYCGRRRCKGVMGRPIIMNAPPVRGTL